MAKVLVTGATGFIGTHLVQALAARGDEVICLRRKSSDVRRLEPLNVRFVAGDVTVPESLAAAIEQVDVVLHLAGMTKALGARQMMRVNRDGAHHVLAACAARPSPPVVVLVSSLAAAGPAPDDRLRTEADPPQPVSHYGRSKRAGELAAEKFADRVPLTIVRPPIVFGEGDRDFFRMIRPIHRFGLHLTPTRSTYRYSLIHAADLASALLLAADRGERRPAAEAIAADTRGLYFVAADEHPTYAELGHLIGQALGRRKTRVLRNPAPVTFGAGLGAELLAQLIRRPSIFNWDKAREAAAGSWACNPQRAKEQLGWQCKAELAARLAQTTRWYRQEGWL